MFPTVITTMQTLGAESETNCSNSNIYIYIYVYIYTLIYVYNYFCLGTPPFGRPRAGLLLHRQQPIFHIASCSRTVGPKTPSVRQRLKPVGLTAALSLSLSLSVSLSLSLSLSPCIKMGPNGARWARAGQELSLKNGAGPTTNEKTKKN